MMEMRFVERSRSEIRFSGLSVRSLNLYKGLGVAHRQGSPANKKFGVTFCALIWRLFELILRRPKLQYKIVAPNISIIESTKIKQEPLLRDGMQ